MISLSAATQYVYPGQDLALTAYGLPNTKIDLIERSDRVLGLIPTHVDYTVASHVSDSNGIVTFHVTMQAIGTVTFYAHQSCNFLGICDQSNDVSISVIAKTADGQPAPGSTTQALGLTADKSVIVSGDVVTFLVTGAPGTQVRLMHRIPTGDNKVADLSLDINGQAKTTWTPAAQQSYTFYVETGACILWGALGCTKSNEVTISVTAGPCAPWDIACQLTGAGGEEGGESFTKWLADTGKTVIILVVILAFVYILAVYVVPGVLTSAAAGTTKKVISGGG